MTRAGTLMLTALALASAAFAQQQPVAGFVNEVQVNNITVEVQVRDADGLPVNNLKKDDFRIIEDDLAQKVTNFYAVNAGEVTNAADEALAGQPAQRQLVIFFDLFLLTESDKRLALAGLRDQLAVGLPPAMTVAVASYDGTLRINTPPTTSTQRVLAALKEVERTTATGLQRQIRLSGFDARDLRGREPMIMGPGPRAEVRRMVNEEYWLEMRRMVGSVSEALAATLQRFSATQARKVALMVSPGFPKADNVPVYEEQDIFWNMVGDSRNLGLLGGMASLASELEYTLYCLDPSGLHSPIGMDRTSDLESRDALDTGFWRESDRKDSLIRAARLTGGEAVFSTNGGAVLADVERLTATFYSLGYQPDHVGDGKTHSIRVEVIGHPDYVLTHRTSYIDRPFEQREAERTRAALLTGDDANPLGIELVLDKAKTRTKLNAASWKAHTIDAELRIPYARLVMLPRDEVAWGQVLVVMLVVDGKGNQSELSHQRVPITIPANKLEEARQRGYFAYRFTLQMEGGEQSLRVGVQDTLARLNSTIVADLRL